MGIKFSVMLIVFFLPAFMSGASAEIYVENASVTNFSLNSVPVELNNSINSVRFRIFTDDVDDAFAQHLIAAPPGLNSSINNVRFRIFTDDVDDVFAQHLIAAPPGLNSSINSVRFRIFTDDVDNGFAQHLIAVPSGLNSSINSVRFRIFIDDVDGLLHPNIAPYLSAVPPVADCGADKVKCENVGSPVQFDGSSSSGSIISYTWNFGDNTNGTGVAPKHIYSMYRWNGTAYKPYTVNLTVTDNGGLTNMTSAFVTIWITGDANGDGKVNIMDASVIGLKWNTADACADLNNDGKVNIIDASIIGLNWGKVA